MLKLNIANLAHLRGIKKVYSYLMKLGLSHSISQRLSTGSVKSIRFDHLEKLCLILQCTPNDLLEWNNDSTSINTHHPMKALVRDPKSLAHLDKIKSMSLDKLARLNDLIADLE
ncbi:MAG: helix-turn-helix transcriptional regulator [Reichenbachiella sp.]